MPENLQNIAFASSEYEQVAHMRIATQALRDPPRQRVHPAPHVRHAGREPDPRPARNRDRRRSGTPSTRDSAAASTSRSTVTREPSARAISIRPEADGSISGAAGSSLAGAAPSGEETTTGTKPPTTRARSRYWRRQLKTGCAFTSCRRAATETETPGRQLSATTRRFRASLHRRRRPRPSTPEPDRSAVSDIRTSAHLSLVDTCRAPTFEPASSPIPEKSDRRPTPEAYVYSRLGGSDRGYRRSFGRRGSRAGFRA